MQKITSFMMFNGDAELAMNFYISLFENSGIVSLARYGENEEGAPGTVKHATFYLNSHQFMCTDSIVFHGFGFTPAISMHVKCNSEEEITKLFAALSDKGKILMPLDKYPFADKYAWVSDRFGVSWQLAF